MKAEADGFLGVCERNQPSQWPQRANNLILLEREPTRKSDGTGCSIASRGTLAVEHRRFVRTPECLAQSESNPRLGVEGQVPVSVWSVAEHGRAGQDSDPNHRSNSDPNHRSVALAVRRWRSSTERTASRPAVLPPTMALTESVPHERQQKHDAETTECLPDGAQHRQTALRRAGLGCQVRRHGNRTPVERIF